MIIAGYLAALMVLAPTTKLAQDGLQAGQPVKVRLFSRSFGPQNTIEYARAGLRWEVWPDGSFEVTKVEATVDGNPIEAMYVSSQRAVVIEPAEPFEPGTHNVEVKVTVNNSSRFTKKWSFTIAPNARKDAPTYSTPQNEILTILNRYRKTIGTAAFSFDSRLTFAATGHTEYILTNKEQGHVQKPGKPLFIGELPTDRAARFGWVMPTWESLAFRFPSAGEGLRTLFDSPYHRISLMMPGTGWVGIGIRGETLCLLGWNEEVAGTVLSPAADETDVPLSWADQERPDPLRLWSKASRPTGYPIVVAHHGNQNERLQQVTATLTLNGKPVPVFVNTPSNDDQLTNAVVILPENPLVKNSLYEVNVAFTDIAGNRVEKKWSFRTEVTASK